MQLQILVYYGFGQRLGLTVVLICQNSIWEGTTYKSFGFLALTIDASDHFNEFIEYLRKINV